MRTLWLFTLALPLLGQMQTMKTHFGDDPRWADPAYDDRAWTSEEDPAASRYWTRSKVRVPSSAVDPVIGVTGTIMEVYADGRLIGKRGEFPPAFADAHRAYATFRLPPDLAQPGRVVLVAVRRWDPPGARPRGFGAPRELHIHSAAETFYHEYHSSLQRSQRGALATFGIMSIALLLLLLAQHGQDRSREFLLSAAFCVSFLLWSLTVLLTMTVGVAGWNIINGLLVTATYVLGLELHAHLAGVRPDFWIRAGQVLFLIPRLALILGALYDDSPAWLRPVADVYIGAPFALLATALLILVRYRSGAAASLWQSLVLTSAFALAAFGAQGASVRGTRQLSLFDISVPMTTSGFTIFGLALCWVMLGRFRSTSAQAAALEGQMAAAREVQQMLLERRVADAPDYGIHPVYLPAENVGGDFFRILPAGAGSTLVVVGDVSGKGLRAAMVVSVVIGALLNRRSNQPAEVLTELNRALAGQLDGGFVTCQAALLQPGGRLTLANAGHLRPYAGGIEVALPDGLPLGVIADFEYEQASCQVEGQLTILSDGVVEAENAQRELFGFDRTRAISTEPAAEIAEAARAWGQNDDITVVTVRRATT